MHSWSRSRTFALDYAFSCSRLCTLTLTYVPSHSFGYTLSILGHTLTYFLTCNHTLHFLTLASS
ncbi:hypothetical protein BDQ17DRAFT_1372010 [Cyathus striatus]|nr:hypothetical protein BDQ17DRAFT_1372010 [Cyathus striatus]